MYSTYHVLYTNNRGPTFPELLYLINRFLPCRTSAKSNSRRKSTRKSTRKSMLASRWIAIHPTNSHFILRTAKRETIHYTFLRQVLQHLIKCLQRRNHVAHLTFTISIIVVSNIVSASKITSTSD